MLVGCHFALEVWHAAITLTVGVGCWRGDSLEENLKQPWQNKRLEDFEALPLLVCWAFWTSRNEMLFKDKVMMTPIQVFFKLRYAFESSQKEIIC
jgi:hypothetical protein